MSRRARWAWGLLALLLTASLVRPAQATDTVVYYHTDALRSVAVVTNSSGAVIERTHYAPYGQVLNRALRDGPGYGGHREDANTGLVYMQQRYYDPESGRFLSADPVQADGNGGTFNRYWYANNNPYRHIDPDGRAPCTGTHIVGPCGPNVAVILVNPPSNRATATSSRGGNASAAAQGSHGDMSITQGERQDAQAGNVEAYYRARLAQGDPIAKIGLASLHPPGGLRDYLFGGEFVNLRLEAFSRVYAGHSINIAAVRTDLMNAQIRAIDADKTGIIGLLSPGQVYDYHVTVFRNYGLPSTAFGGTPITGQRWEAYFTARLPHIGWCQGCDR